MKLLPSIPVHSVAAWDKEQLTLFAETHITDLVEDGADVMSLMAQAAKLEYLAEKLKEFAKTATIEEVRSYGKDGLKRFGVSMVVKESGTRYDYSLNPTWALLNATVVAANEARKAHETYLKSLPYEGRMYVCEDTGDTFRAYPPAKTAGETVFLEIK